MSYLFLLPLLLLIASCGGSGDGRPAPVGPAVVRQGEVVNFTFSSGEEVVWSVDPPDAGLITEDGRFVGYKPGQARIVARSAGLDIERLVTIESRRDSQGTFRVVGHGLETGRYTSDLWLAGSFGYTGTWLGRAVEDRLPGNQLFAWDLSNPAAPARTVEIAVDARTVNDVKIRSDRSLAVLTHEGSQDGLNGITILSLADPLRPSVITRFTETMETGVHNVWIEGNFVYAVVDGEGKGLRIIDISVPAHPVIAATFVAETSFLHDVMVRDGLAFLSHWDAGLIILDVGNGIAGGSPNNPVEVSRILTEGGQTHNAWYWPDAGYVFVGEEDFAAPGRMHVIDVRDLRSPREVATFSVPETTPHNFWLDEGKGILYAAWYSAGLRAVDVTGELLGELDKQGREIASLQYGSNGGCRSADGTCTWAPQLHQGLVFASDLNTGLWVFEPQF